MNLFRRVVKILIYLNYTVFLIGIIYSFITPLEGEYSYNVFNIMKDMANMSALAIFEVGMITIISSAIIALMCLAYDLYSEREEKYTIVSLAIVSILIFMLLNLILF